MNRELQIRPENRTPVQALSVRPICNLGAVLSQTALKGNPHFSDSLE